MCTPMSDRTTATSRRSSSFTTSKPLTVQYAAEPTIYKCVVGLEVYNGATGDRENAVAVAVREHIGLRGIGGSDAHSEHGLGCCATVFERAIRDERELIEELRAGRF